MAPKRGRDGEEPTSSTKRNKTSHPGPVPHDEKHEVPNTDSMRPSMQLAPQQTPAPFMDLHEFDEEAESRNADAMRLRMLGGQRRSPVPDFNLQGGRIPSIKLEDEDTSFINSPTNFANNSFQPDRMSETDDLNLIHDDDSNPLSDLNIAAQIKAAAAILRQNDQSHAQFQNAVRRLKAVISPAHNVTVQTVVNNLVDLGVHPDIADEVAAILRQQAPGTKPFAETAATLTNIESLEELLGVLRESAPDEGVKSQLLAWRKIIRKRQKHEQRAQDKRHISILMTPDLEQEALNSMVLQSGSADGSGGPGASTEAVEEELPQVSLQNTEVEDGPGAETEIVEDSVISYPDTTKLSPKSKKERSKEFERLYPRSIHIFMLHAMEARETTPDLQLLDKGQYQKTATDMYEAMPKKLKNKWYKLHGRLRRGDSDSRGLPTGAEIFESQGCLPRLKKASWRVILRKAAESSAGAFVLARPEIKSDAEVHDEHFPHQEQAFTTARRPDPMKQFKPTMIWYPASSDNLRCAAFVVNTPGLPTFYFVLETFRAACAKAYGEAVDLNQCEQLSEHLWQAKFHRQEDAESAIEQKLPIVLGGQNLCPEALPNTRRTEFQFHPDDLGLPKREVACRIHGAFDNLKSAEGVAALSGFPMLFAAKKGHYYTHLPIKPECDRLLRFFLPYIGQHDVAISCWIPAVEKYHNKELRLIAAPDWSEASTMNQSATKKRFPSRRSLFLFHTFEACKLAGTLLPQQDLDDRASHIWKDMKKGDKRRWSDLYERLLQGDQSVLWASTVRDMLLWNGVPGRVLDGARAKQTEASKDVAMDSDADDDSHGSGGSPDSRDAVEHTESGFSPIEEEANASRSDRVDEADEYLSDMENFAGPPVFGYCRLVSNASSKGSRVQRMVMMSTSTQVHKKSRVNFVINTPDCPVTDATNAECVKLCAALFGQDIQSVAGPFKKHTISVLFKSQQMAKDAICNSASLLFGKHRVYAEPHPRHEARLLRCNFSDHGIPERDLAKAVQGLFQAHDTKVTLLRYPGNSYLIRLSKPMPLLRLYVKLPWSKTQVCMASFEMVDAVKKRGCPVCLDQHHWPCPQAEVVQMSPSMNTKKSKQKRDAKTKRGSRGGRSQNKKSRG